jgi:outer membrane murein-binding lipoprotein Lpp
MLDRRSFDTGTSQAVQSDLNGIVSRLEANIDQRTADVNAAMSDFQADGVSEEYHHVEQRWTRAANEVRQIIRLVHDTMEQNDTTATGTLNRAAAAVQSIG